MASLEEDIRKHMLPEEGDRKFVMYTGQEGWFQFNLSLRKHNLIDLAKWFVEEEVFTKEEADRIIEMIESPDLENLTVAETIINVKLKERPCQ